MIERSINGFLLSFEKLGDAGRALTYTARCSDSSSPKLVTESACDEATQTCEVDELEPAMYYNLQIVSCFNAGGEEVCSPPSEGLVEWTMPEGIP